jgi:fructose-1-phosphate kinase PfkB-like protein
VARVVELEAALEGKEKLLEEAVAGGEAAVAGLSAELEQVKREVEASTAAAAAAAQAGTLYSLYLLY